MTPDTSSAFVRGRTAFYRFGYSLLLLPVTLAQFVMGMCTIADLQGKIGLGLIVAANVFMIGRCIALYRNMDVRSARKVMFGSYLYLPVVMLAMLLSKV